ncbi:RNA-dependent RNA polymerase 1-like [Humulus lupulus]|uniref:RNA-dependent RNA polymerase 1-like n=1 Tax=Humulus lupulus TaxID=3486 RepID=UPI002B406241|nr:RNA-dependent RNA polymerase 1-like [Humulus lupulus]
MGSKTTIHLYGFSCFEINDEAVKKFLEQYSGEGTVCGVEVGQSRAQANVHFTDFASAEIILSMANDQELWHGDSCVKAWELGMENVSKPKAMPWSMDQNITLYFGCQVSKKMFSVLWKTKNVGMKLRTQLRKPCLYFYFSYSSAEYKLELSHKSIWQIELHRPLGQTTMFLVLQLLGAPRIYKQDESVVNYFKDSFDGGWIRDVDFTPSCCIGQSSAICLEIPTTAHLPNLRNNFVHYKEDGGQFLLQKGSPFSSNCDLVPMVLPPQKINLPYKILFKINSLVQQGYLPGEALKLKFFQLVDPNRIDIEYIESALNKLFQRKECCYEPHKWLTKQYKKYKKSGRTPKLHLDKGVVYMHQVQITPTKVYFTGPKPEGKLSNSVLSNYPNDIENFLRVSFVDEDWDKMRINDLWTSPSSANEKRHTTVYDRILFVLREGIFIGDKKFDFLGFTSCELHNISALMFASREGLSAEDIKNWMLGVLLTN